MTLVTLRSAEGRTFQVSVEGARCSQTLRTMLDDLGVDENDPIPVPNVSSEVLELIVSWIEFHKDDPPISGDNMGEAEPIRHGRAAHVVFSEWDRNFFDMNRENLVAITIAANHLQIKGLLQMAGKTIADTMIKGKSPEEIRQAFNIPNDLDEPAPAPRARPRRPAGQSKKSGRRRN